MPLSSVVLHRGCVARLLAQAVSRGRYELHPAVLRTIRVGGKDRVVFAYPVLDLVVHGVVADLLLERMEPTLSDRLHSYRTVSRGERRFGVRPLRACSPRRPPGPPRARGLYVLRRDVDAYTDSIPLGPSSAIWPLVTDLLGGDARRGRAWAWLLITDVVRPRLLGAEGGLATRFRGVATGQPISVLAFNLYLRALDRELEAVLGAFSARYSDDLLVAHPDPAVARALSDRMDARLAELGLRLGEEAARPVSDWGRSGVGCVAGGAGHATRRLSLGMRVGMDGTIALGEEVAACCVRRSDGHGTRRARCAGPTRRPAVARWRRW